MNPYFSELYETLVSSAPALLLGFIVAGFLHYLLPRSRFIQYLKTPGLLGAVKGTLVGIPLPLCSCSVIPVATSLKRFGASKSSTGAFLVSTPEIGVDSFLLSMSLLGAPITWARVLMASVTSVLTGTLMGRGEPAETASKEIETEKHTYFEALKFGLIKLPGDLAPLLIVGFLAAAILGVHLPDGFASEISKPFALLVSFPLYICAASMTPVAAVLFAKGASAGTVLVFLLAGPASNITTLLAVKQEFGTKDAVVYLLSVSGSTLAMAYLVDAFLNFEATELAHIHQHSQGSFIWVFLLVALLAYGLWRRYQPLESHECCAKG